MLNILQVLPVWLTSSPSADIMLAICCMISRGTLLAQQLQVHPNLCLWEDESQLELQRLPSSHSLMVSLGKCCHILPINYSLCFSSWVCGTLGQKKSLLRDPHQEGWPPWSTHIILAETLLPFATSSFYSLFLQTAVSHPKQGFQALRHKPACVEKSKKCLSKLKWFY